MCTATTGPSDFPSLYHAFGEGGVGQYRGGIRPRLARGDKAEGCR